MGIDEHTVRQAFAEGRSQHGTTRRDAIKRVAAICGGAVLAGQTAFLTGCAINGGVARSMEQLFMASDVQLLDEIADTVLPQTSTPGAKAAGVGPFMIVMVTDTYTANEQRTFTGGLATIDAASLRRFGVNFVNATSAQRTRLLERIDREQYEYMQAQSDSAMPHYFRLMKQLTLLGYFTSEIGCTQAQRYRETPARFEPCIPYSPGDRAWAEHA